jgi:hypothetical protein
LKEFVENFTTMQQLSALPESVEFIKNLIDALIKAKENDLSGNRRLLDTQPS